MNRESDTPPKWVSKERSVVVMTRKSFIPCLIVVALMLTTILPAASASEPLAMNQRGPDEELQTVYITWQYPIPPSERGDKLNMSVGVLMDGKTYASQEVFDILGIQKCPHCSHCKGVTMTVDGETGVYYPLREGVEQFGYSVLWAPNSEQGGEALNYWVYIAKKDTGTNWVQVVFGEDQETGYKNYRYFYAYPDDESWCIDWEDETERIPKKDVTVVE